MNKIVSLTDFWFAPCVLKTFGGFWYDTCKDCLPHKAIAQGLCSSIQPPTHRHSVDSGVTLYLKSAISRTFCQGYMIIGVRGADVIVVVEDCSSSGRVVFHGRSLVVFTNRVARHSRAYQSPLVEVQ